MTLKELQKKYEISVKGFDIPRLVDSFSAMEAQANIPKYLFRNILNRVEDNGFGFTKPTPVQMQAIPTLMSQRELLLFAPTGSGKTIAFSLPMLALLDSPPKEGEYSGFLDTHINNASADLDDDDDDDSEADDDAKAASKVKSAKAKAKKAAKDKKPINVLPFRGLVLAPTRELAFQTYKVLKLLSQSRDWRIVMLTKDSERQVKKTLKTVDDDVTGGEGEELDAESVFAKQQGDDAYRKYGVHNGNMTDVTNDGIQYRNVLVTTPMILLMLLQKTNAIMPLTRFVVFDEADRLFDMGFIEQIDRIMGRCVNPRILRVLCSATITQGVEILAKNLLRDPVRVVVGGRNVAQSNVSQKLVYVGNEDGKPLAIRQMMQEGLKVPMLIFTQSKERAMQVYDELRYENIRPAVIHSDMSVGDRLTVMNNFRSGKVWTLICTDLMARGIDFKHVNCVVNFDFPQTVASYIHRIGRTGRAGRRGEAVTFVTDQDQVLLHEIAHIVRDSAIAQEFGYSALKNKDSVSSVQANCPDWMLEAPKSTSNAIKKLAENAPVRHTINMEHKKERREQQAKKRKRLGKIHAKSDIVSRGESGSAKTVVRKSAEEKNATREKKNKRRNRVLASKHFAKRSEED
jgi:ATP-dependent RNA helicase DDX52/ROK1